MGNFELGKTSRLFYKFITVVSTILLYHRYGRRFISFFLTILLYHMYGRRFILFFSPPGFNIGKSTNTEYYSISYLYVALNTAFEN